MNKFNSKSRRRNYNYISLLILIVIFSLIFILLYTQRTKSPVPPSIKQGVNFQIYYPDQKKLPVGYKLNIKSFTSPQKGVIIFSIDYDKGKKIIISEQQTPSDADLQRFYANIIPLRNEHQTNIGKAEIGSHGSGNTLQTIVSLPTTKGTWLIMTAPPNIDQNKLDKVLDSIKN